MLEIMTNEAESAAKIIVVGAYCNSFSKYSIGNAVKKGRR